MWLPPRISNLSCQEAIHVSVYINVLYATQEVMLELHVRQCILTFQTLKCLSYFIVWINENITKMYMCNYEILVFPAIFEVLIVVKVLLWRLLSTLGKTVLDTLLWCDKHHDQGSIQKKEFIWAYGFRGVRVHHGGKVCHQAAGLGLEQRILSLGVLILSHTQCKLEMTQYLTLRAASCDMPPLTRPYCLSKPPQTAHQPGSKCPNAGAYGGTFSFKLPQNGIKIACSVLVEATSSEKKNVQKSRLLLLCT